MSWAIVKRLISDPRISSLASSLGCNQAQALGHAVALTFWAAEFTDAGETFGWPDSLVAKRSHFDGDPGRFRDALLASGIIVGTTIVDVREISRTRSVTKLRVRKHREMASVTVTSVTSSRAPARAPVPSRAFDLEPVPDPEVQGQNPGPNARAGAQGGTSPLDRLRRSQGTSTPRSAVVVAEHPPLAPAPLSEPPAFAEFMAAYPKPANRAAAREAWAREAARVGSEARLAQLTRPALEAARASADWRKEGGRYVPLAARWLDDRAYEVAGAEPSMEQARILMRIAGNVSFQGPEAIWDAWREAAAKMGGEVALVEWCKCHKTEVKAGCQKQQAPEVKAWLRGLQLAATA